jgi:hypothetical protein
MAGNEESGQAGHREADCIGRRDKVNSSIFIIPAVFLVAMVAIFGIRKAPGIFLGILAACAVIYATAAIVHA